MSSIDLLDSSSAFNTNTVSEWEDPSTTANVTNAYTVAKDWQPAAEYRTIRDVAVTKLTGQEHTDQDTTESGSDVDSTYISTTISRAGERTLLSTTSNSISPYVEGSSSSKIVPHAISTSTGQVDKTGVTQQMNYTENTSVTESDHTEEDLKDFHTNATQNGVSETEVSHGSQVTQSHTGQPTVTEKDFEPLPKTSNPSSTPPLTVKDSFDSEMDTIPDSSTNQSFYRNSSSSSSIIPPTVLPDDTHTNVSHQDGETTGTPTDHVSTSTGEKPHEPNTHVPRQTVPTVPRQTTERFPLWDKTTREQESQSTQQTFVSQTNSHPESTEVLSTAVGPSTNKPPITKEDTDEPNTVPVTSTILASTGTTVPFTTHRFQASTSPEAHSIQHSTPSAIETTQKTTPTTEQQYPTNSTTTPSLSASSSQSGAGATDLSTLHFETSTATPGSTKANNQHTTASYSKTTPTMNTTVTTIGKRTETEATTTQMTVELSLTPGVFA